MSTVAQLWIHPVKSMLGTGPEALTLVPGGVLGDRGYAFFEVATGQRISAKRYGAMLGCRARLVEQPTADGPVPPIEVTFPDGSVVTDHADITKRVSELLGFEVTLTAGDPGTLVDLAPVHILAASTLRLLAEQYPDGDWDPRRFRPNIFVDDDSAGDGDDDWLGCDIHIGAEVVLHVVIPTPPVCGDHPRPGRAGARSEDPAHHDQGQAPGRARARGIAQRWLVRRRGGARCGPGR